MGLQIIAYRSDIILNITSFGAHSVHLESNSQM